MQRNGAAAQESRGRLNAIILDRVSNALTYRVFGCETQRNIAFEEHLNDYEKSAVKANIWVAVCRLFIKLFQWLVFYSLSISEAETYWVTDGQAGILLCLQPLSPVLRN